MVLRLHRALVHGSGSWHIVVTIPRSGVATDEVSETEPVQVRDAQLRPEPSVGLMERNRNIRSIHRLGRREWYKWSGYSKRSVVENTIYRYKTTSGRGLSSRTLAGQLVEVRLACRVLNIMTRLGMPDSYRVA